MVESWTEFLKKQAGSPHAKRSLMAKIKVLEYLNGSLSACSKHKIASLLDLTDELPKDYNVSYLSDMQMLVDGKKEWVTFVYMEGRGKNLGKERTYTFLENGAFSYREKEPEIEQ